MTTRTVSVSTSPAQLTFTHWALIGLQAALAAVIAALAAQAAILALWPELSSFKPLDSYARTALFTFIPALAATGVFAWLVKTQAQPGKKFLWIATGVLLLSFIPDFGLPLPNKTVPGSTATAFLHLVAGIVTTALILTGYRRAAGERRTRQE